MQSLRRARRQRLRDPERPQRGHRLACVWINVSLHLQQDRARFLAAQDHTGITATSVLSGERQARDDVALAPRFGAPGSRRSRRVSVARRLRRCSADRPSRSSFRSRHVALERREHARPIGVGPADAAEDALLDVAYGQLRRDARVLRVEARRNRSRTARPSRRPPSRISTHVVIEHRGPIRVADHVLEHVKGRHLDRVRVEHVEALGFPDGGVMPLGERVEMLDEERIPVSATRCAPTYRGTSRGRAGCAGFCRSARCRSVRQVLLQHVLLVLLRRPAMRRQRQHALAFEQRSGGGAAEEHEQRRQRAVARLVAEPAA